MALIIEDGTGSNPAANSYRSVADLRLYASLRGIDITALTDTECEVLLIKAMDYLEAQGKRYKGRKANIDQPLQWPRADAWGIVYDYALYSSTEIPRELEYAQLALAIEARDNDLQPNQLPSDKGPVTSETIEGAVSIAYANPGSRSRTPAFAKPEALLANLYKRNGLTLVRS